MSLALPSSLAPATPSRSSSASASSASSAARSNEQDSGDSPSFGEVLSRSLAPAAESAEPARAKPVAAAAAKRQPAQPPADPQELVNTLALALLAPDSQALPSLPAGAATAGAALAGTPGAAAATTIVAAGLPATAASAVTVGQDGEVLPAASSAPAQDLRTAAADPAVMDPATARTAAAAAAPALAAASATAKDSAQTTPAGKPGAATPDAALTPVSGGSAAPGAGTDTATSDPSSQRGSGQDQAASRPDRLSAEGLGTTPASPRGPASRASSEAPASGTRADSAVLPALAPTVAAAAPLLPGSDPLGAGAAMALMPGGAAANTASASTPTAVQTALLAPEVGDGEWGKALGQQMLHMGKAGQQVAELQLNPPGLGPLKVTLAMNEQQVQATFVSAHAAVRAAVEAALPQLRATLADNGINLGNTSVSDQGQQQASTFAQRENGQSEQHANNAQRGYRNERQAADAAGLAPGAAPEPARPRQGLSVDTYA